MQKDSFKSFKLTKGGLVIQGSRCEMTLTFQDLAVILSELGKALPSEPRQEPAVAAGWSGSRERSMSDLVRQEQPYAELPIPSRRP